MKYKPNQIIVKEMLILFEEHFLLSNKEILQISRVSLSFDISLIRVVFTEGYSTEVLLDYRHMRLFKPGLKPKLLTPESFKEFQLLK